MGEGGGCDWMEGWSTRKKNTDNDTGEKGGEGEGGGGGGGFMMRALTCGLIQRLLAVSLYVPRCFNKTPECDTWVRLQWKVRGHGRAFDRERGDLRQILFWGGDRKMFQTLQMAN